MRPVSTLIDRMELGIFTGIKDLFKSLDLLLFHHDKILLFIKIRTENTSTIKVSINVHHME